MNELQNVQAHFSGAMVEKVNTTAIEKQRFRDTCQFLKILGANVKLSLLSRHLRHIQMHIWTLIFDSR